MKVLNVLIVDDEEPARKNLASLLKNYCEGINIAGEAESASQARQLLTETEVDALLLDISMPNENGFDLLESIANDKYLFVFVTAHDQYALRALRASAVDYLQKPVDIDELKQAITKLQYMHSLKTGHAASSTDYRQSLNSLISNLTGKKGVQRLCLPGTNGFSIVDVNDIVYLDADSNYTIFHLTSLKKIVVSKSIKEFEDLLNPELFFRVHKSSIINLKHLREFSRVDGNYAIMMDNSSVAVSRRKLQEFLAAVEAYSNQPL